MKKILALSAVVAAAAVASPATAALVNSNFETGDFTGWTVSIPDGTSEFPPTDRPAGEAGVVSAWGPQGSLSGPVTPQEGNNFAFVGTGATCYFTENRTYNIFASQSISLGAGDTLLGWAAFYNGDYEPQDTAWVSVLDHAGVQLSTPWQAASGGLSGSPTVAYLSATPWTQWQWVAPAAGLYTLELGVTTFGDDRYASYGFFDDINVLHAEAVPEPSTALLVLGGLAGLFGIRLRRKVMVNPLACC